MAHCGSMRWRDVPPIHHKDVTMLGDNRMNPTPKQPHPIGTGQRVCLRRVRPSLRHARALLIIAALLMALLPAATHAQDPTSPPRPVISADNWQQLGVVSRIGSGSITSPPLLAPDGTLSVAYNSLGLWLTDPATPDAPPQLVEVGAVTSIAFSPDNRWLAATMLGRDVLIWNRQQPITPTPTLTLPTERQMNRADFSADGAWLITLAGTAETEDYRGYRWSVADGQLLGEIEGITPRVNEWRVMDDYWIAGILPDGNFRRASIFVLVQFSTGDMWTVGERAMQAYAFDPATRRFAFGAFYSTTRDSTNDVELWAERDGQFELIGAINLAYAETRDIQGLWFADDGQRLLVESTGYYGHRLQVYDLSGLMSQGSAGISERGNYRLDVATEAAQAPTIPIDANPVYNQLGTDFGPAPTYRPLLFSDDELLAGLGFSALARLGLSDPLPPIAFNERWVEEDATLEVRYGQVALRQAEPPSLLHELIQAHGIYVNSWSTDGQWVVYRHFTADGLAWRVQSRADPTDITDVLFTEANPVIISPDAQWLLMVDPSYTLRLEARDGRTPAVDLGTTDERLRVIAFSPDSRWLAVSSWGEVRLWSLHDGTVTPLGSTGPGWADIQTIVYSPTVPVLAIASQAGVYLFDLEAWQAAGGYAEAYAVYRGATSAVAFSPDGTRLAVTPAESGYVHLYEVVE